MIRKITKRQWTYLFLILLAITLYFILPVAIPLVVALITAIILNPIVHYIQMKMKINRKFSVIIVFLSSLLLVGFAGTFIIIKSIGQTVVFVEQIPSYFNQINLVYSKWEADFQQYAQTLPPEFVKQISNTLEENLIILSTTVKEIITIDNIAQLFAKVPQYLISFLVYLIALFLFMLELPLLKSKVYSVLTNETAEKVSFMNTRLVNVLLGFLKAQFLVSVIIFIVALIGLLFIIPELALIMSLIIWIIDLIPIIGSIAILGPWTLYIFISGDNVLGVKLTILAVILLAIRRIIEPKLMGQHIGLSPLATLIAMFLGLKLFGILGFALGPLLVIAFSSAKEAGIIKWELKI